MAPDTRHGFDWEIAFADAVGGDLKPGSGNKWYCRGDIGDSSFLWSCKSTKNKNFELESADVQEIVDIVEAPGGTGNQIPGMAIRFGRHEMVAMRLEDFVKLMTSEVPYIRESKADSKRRAAGVPQLLREDDDET